jgi:hypothetical protein
LSRFAIRFWFCLASALLAAAIADPALEFASNSGLFGPGSYTDHSNLDVVPALSLGFVLFAIYLVYKAAKALTGYERSPLSTLRLWNRSLARAMPRLLGPIFALQIIALYVMETAEQFAVYGHALGGTTWLGAPTPISLLFHGALCAAISFALVRLVSGLAATTLRVVRSLCLTRLPRRAEASIIVRFRGATETTCAAWVRGLLGERAPPVLL